MIKYSYIILFLFVLTNCSLKSVIKTHGVPFLDKKQKLLVVNKSNKNDIKEILGSPSTTSKFDNDVWIYIERQQTQSELINLGRMEVYKNDVLVLEFNNFGILKEKKLYDINNMENIKIAKETTLTVNKNKSFLYDFMSSMRQKMNDPLGQRAKKRRETNQR